MKYNIPILDVGLLKLIPAVLLLVLSGCQTTNIRDDYSLETNSGTNVAIVIGSVSQNLDTSRATIAEFRIDNQVKNQTKKMYSRHTNEFIGALANKYDYQDEHSGGRIFVLEIEAGSHLVDYWEIELQGRLSLHPKVPPPALEFSIEHGQIMYLGNFHVQIQSGKNLFGQLVPVAGLPSIKNEYDRDIKIFHEKYPQFKSKPIIKNVLHEGDWKNELSDQEELVIPTSEDS